MTPVPTPSVTPVFASDEEALAAAEESYKRYISMEDSIAQEGGRDPERLAEIVTDEWLQTEFDTFERFRQSGRLQVGSTSVTDVELQRVDEFKDGTAEVVVYVCVDFSDTSFVDASGAQVAPEGPRTLTLEATFVASDVNHLLLKGNEPWSESIC